MFYLVSVIGDFTITAGVGSHNKVCYPILPNLGVLDSSLEHVGEWVAKHVRVERFSFLLFIFLL